MAKIKVSFPTYSTLEAPAKSLVNFLTQHGSFCFTPHNGPELVEATITDMSKSGNDCVFTLDDVETNDIIYAYGTLKDENETKTFDATDTIVRLGNDHKITITTDDPSYTDYEDLTFYVVPTDIHKMYGCLQPNDPCVSSGYDVCVPLQPNSEIPETHPVCASAVDYNIGLMILAKTPGAAGNNIRVKFEKDVYDGNSGIRTYVYINDTLNSYVTINVWEDYSASGINDAFNALESPPPVYFLSYSHEDLNFYSCLEEDGDSFEMHLSGGSDADAEMYIRRYSGFNNSTYPNIESQIKQSTTSLVALKEAMTMGTYDYMIDSDELYPMPALTKDDSFINIPVTCKLLSSASNDADLVPYSLICKDILNSNMESFTGKVKFDISEEDKDNHPIDYQLRTSSFFAGRYYVQEDEEAAPIDDNDEEWAYTPPEPKYLYYKMGICAKDGTAESTAVLVNEFKNSTMITSVYFHGFSEDSYNLLGVIPKLYNNEEEAEAESFNYYYGVTNEPGMLQVVRVACSETGANNCINLPCSTIVPLIKTNLDGSAEFKGVMYMQLCTGTYNETTEEVTNAKEATESIIGNDTVITATKQGDMEDRVYLSIVDHDIEEGTFIESDFSIVAM